MHVRLIARVRLALATAVACALSVVAITLGTTSAPAADPVGDNDVMLEHMIEVPGTVTAKDHCDHHHPNVHPGGAHCYSHDHSFENDLCYSDRRDVAHICS